MSSVNVIVAVFLGKKPMYINPFVPNAAFLYPLKTSENLTIFWCFQVVVKGCIGNDKVKQKVGLYLLVPQYIFELKMLESKIVFYGEPLQPSTTSIYFQISKLKRKQPHLFILRKWKEKQNNLKSDSHLAKVCFYLLQWKPLKNDEQWFLWLLTWNNGEQW